MVTPGCFPPSEYRRKLAGSVGQTAGGSSIIINLGETMIADTIPTFLIA